MGLGPHSLFPAPAPLPVTSALSQAGAFCPLTSFSQLNGTGTAREQNDAARTATACSKMARLHLAHHISYSPKEPLGHSTAAEKPNLVWGHHTPAFRLLGQPS